MTNAVAADRAFRDLHGYGPAPPVIEWPGGARVAISVAVHFNEGAERSPLYGDELPESSDPESASEGGSPGGRVRDLQIESVWEYGARCGLWRLLRVFDDTNIRTTFFCSGRAIEQNPPAAEAINRSGHEIGAQGYRFVPYAPLAADEERADIRAAVLAIERMTGSRPIGWQSRQPSLNTRSLLAEEGGFVYESDSFADDLPFTPADGAGLLTIPNSFELTDRKYAPYPGVAGFSRPGAFLTVLSSALDRLLVESAKWRQMMTVSLHPRISGRPSRAAEVRDFIRYAQRNDGVWFARRDEIARIWLTR